MAIPRQTGRSTRNSVARIVARGIAATTTFALVSCTDASTAPKSAPEMVTYPNVLRDVIPDAEVITVTQTTDLGSKAKGPVSHRVKVTKIQAGYGGVPAKLKASLRKAVTEQSLATDGAPLPRLTYPSSRALSHRGHWTARHPFGDGTDAILEASGDNDEPATMTRLIRNGQLVATIQRTFQRGTTSWELLRQESTSADKQYRDVIEVKRKPANVTPAVSLLRGSLGGPNRSLGISPNGPRFDEGCGGGIGEEYGDPEYAEDKCASELSNYNWATLEAAALAVQMGGACLSTVVNGPGGVLLCLAANALLLKGLNDQDNAWAAYEACKRFYMSHSTASGPCEPEAEFDVGGFYASLGGGGTGNEEMNVSTCWIWFEYDRESGEILEYQVLYCA